MKKLFTILLVTLAAAGIARAGGWSADELQNVLDNSSRSEADRARDAARRPAEVLAFVGIEPGMTVIDLMAASGWYTEVLSAAVGPDGTVYSQNPEMMLEFRDGANDKALSARLADGRLPNVVRKDGALGDAEIEPESVDAAFTALNIHDTYNFGGDEAALAQMKAIYRILRPGGVLGLVDHVGVSGQDNAKLHRIEPGIVKDIARRAGFEVEAESDILAHPADDHTKMVFGKLRGKTDRFVLRLRKPG